MYSIQYNAHLVKRYYCQGDSSKALVNIRNTSAAKLCIEQPKEQLLEPRDLLSYFFFNSQMNTLSDSRSNLDPFGSLVMLLIGSSMIPVKMMH